MYNPYESGWLDHQRLRVPKWRKWLEFLSFGILLSLFVATLACESRRSPQTHSPHRHSHVFDMCQSQRQSKDEAHYTFIVKELGRVHPVEGIFVVVTFGFMLEEFAASKEHGWTGEFTLHVSTRIITD